MKKMLLKFADATLRKDELKSIKGGYGASCGRCSDDRSYLCSISFGGSCSCNKSGLGTGCEA